MPDQIPTMLSTKFLQPEPLESVKVSEEQMYTANSAGLAESLPSCSNSDLKMAFTTPAFSILISWLAFKYHQTGIWDSPQELLAQIELAYQSFSHSSFTLKPAETPVPPSTPFIPSNHSIPPPATSVSANSVYNSSKAVPSSSNSFIESSSGSITGPHNETISSPTLKPLVYQFPFPAMLGFTPVAGEALEERPSPEFNKSARNSLVMKSKPGSESSNRTRNKNNSKYIESPYYLAATTILKEVLQKNEGDFQLENPDELALVKLATLVLGLLLAWSRHPILNGLSGRTGKWVILASNKAAKELGIRRANFEEGINFLENLGLLNTSNAGDGSIISHEEFESWKRDCLKLAKEIKNKGEKDLKNGLWSPQALQKTARLYFLNLTAFEKLVENLPESEFYPVTDNTKNEKVCPVQEKGLSQPKIYQKTHEHEFKINSFINSKEIHDNHGSTCLKVKTETQGLSALPVNNNNFFMSTKKKQPQIQKEAGKEIDKLKKPFPKSSKPARNLQGEILRKFLFLREDASFSGYDADGDGKRTNLDERVALRLANDSRYSLDLIKLRYSQVKELWDASVQSRDLEAVRNQHSGTDLIPYLNSNSNSYSSVKPGNASITNPLGLLYCCITNNLHPDAVLPGLKVSRNNPEKLPTPYSASKPAYPISIRRKQLVTPEATGSTDDFFISDPDKIELNDPPCQGQDLTLEELKIIWQKLVEEDLPDRFGLKSNQQRFLVNARLEADMKPETGKQEFNIVLASEIDLRALDRPTRANITIALSQRIGKKCWSEIIFTADEF